jgi:hypothetical protein
MGKNVGIHGGFSYSSANSEFSVASELVENPFRRLSQV